MKIKWLSISNELKLEGGELNHKVADYLMDEIAKELKFRQSGIVRAEKGRINFDGAVFRWVSKGFHFLNLALYADFEIIERSKTTYLQSRFYFTELAAICLGMSPLAVLALLLDFPKHGLGLFAIIWIVVFVGGVILTGFRYNWWIERKQNEYLRKKLPKEILAS